MRSHMSVSASVSVSVLCNSSMNAKLIIRFSTGLVQLYIAGLIQRHFVNSPHSMTFPRPISRQFVFFLGFRDLWEPEA